MLNRTEARARASADEAHRMCPHSKATSGGILVAIQMSDG